MTYERVSSEDQRERETIKTQTDALAAMLEREDGVILVERCVDDGVSGTVPLAERPGGKRLTELVRNRRVDEVWAYKIDRLGRDAVDLLTARRLFAHYEVRLVTVVEGEPDLLGYDVQAVVADHYRRDFLRRSADGMNRAAREGRYCGGIVAYGFCVEGTKQAARLIPDDTIVWGDLTAADIIRQIFRWIAVDGWSARHVADELNTRGVPTSYGKARRGIRGRATQNRWWPGRVLQLVNKPTYKGEMHYGKLSKQSDRPIITARVPRVVSDELWQAAQTSLAQHQRTPPNQRHRYLLRSLIVCSICRLHYTGSRGRDGKVWYRCNGQLVGRGPLKGRCPSKGISGTLLEQVVWGDIERFLRDPGTLLDELAEEMADAADAGAATTEAERTTLEAALQDLSRQRERLLDLYLGYRFERKELDRRLHRIEAHHRDLEDRLQIVSAGDGDARAAQPLDADLLAQLHVRLNAGLSAQERQEIATLLIKHITIHTTLLVKNKKRAKAVVEYRFPVVVATDAGRGSWPQGT